VKRPALDDSPSEKETDMKRRGFLMVGLALLGLAGQVRAADKPDPTGTWKWSVTFNDRVSQFSLAQSG
jgi:hypothetical protein